MKGWLWMLWRYGARRTYIYWRAYRSGMVIDYSEVFTRDELARIGEHFDPAPWEPSR